MKGGTLCFFLCPISYLLYSYRVDVFEIFKAYERFGKKKGEIDKLCLLSFGIGWKKMWNDAMRILCSI